MWSATQNTDTGGQRAMTEAAAAANSPTVRMRQLGMELKRLREVAGKSQSDTARWLDVDQTLVSKWECGDRRVQVAQVKSLCQLYGVEADHAEFLESLAREAGQRGWWVEYGATVPRWFVNYIGMETAVKEIWTYASEPIPGLLQTREYAEAVASSPDVSQLRAVRQQRLRGDDPLTLRVVLNEAVLCRTMGGPDVMRDQIRHVIAMAALPNVTIQVLPFLTGFHPALTGPFTALRFPQEPMNTVYIEIQESAIYLEKPVDVARYTDIFARLTQMALDEEGTIAFLREMERRYSK